MSPNVQERTGSLADALCMDPVPAFDLRGEVRRNQTWKANRRPKASELSELPLAKIDRLAIELVQCGPCRTRPIAPPSRQNLTKPRSDFRFTCCVKSAKRLATMV
ncbi:protein of unknown function [Nitrospira japonica]|uniref:Uncharacterized protein n=1 Tax=Nitrospira japonica TaxID=1325564 RepID=A0A1W1I3W4_9BACT|nr:protein of unknown function [Nitrospira japonica]